MAELFTLTSPPLPASSRQYTEAIFIDFHSIIFDTVS